MTRPRPRTLTLVAYAVGIVAVALAIPLAQTTLASLSIPQAGNYVISAKAVITGDGTATCRLEAAPDTDESRAAATATSPATVANLVVHVFAAAGSANFGCGGAGSVFARDIKIAAIRVGNLVNTG